MKNQMSYGPINSTNRRKMVRSPSMNIENFEKFAQRISVGLRTSK